MSNEIMIELCLRIFICLHEKNEIELILRVLNLADS